MPWGVAAAAAVGAVGTAYAGSKQSKAVERSAEISTQAQREAQAQLRSDLAPYSQAGLPALEQTNALLGLRGQDAATAAMGQFQQNPAYQFQMSEGLRAIDASAASRGLLQSGGTLKAAQTFGSNLANQSFGEYYNRLMGMAQVGQNSAAGVGAAGTQTAAGIAQTATSLGGAQASIYGNTASGIGNAVQQGYQNYQYNRLISGGGGAGGSVYGGTDAPWKTSVSDGGMKY